MKKTPIQFYAFLGILLFTTQPAIAADLCDIYEEYCPGYVKTVTSGASYPSFSDTFNVNPASLPTTSTPLGVEAIASTSGSHSANTINFTLLKGFTGMGIGVANNSDNTFYSYNLVQALQKTPYKDVINNFLVDNAVSSSINFGAAVAPFSGQILQMISVPTFGLNIRYNQLTNNWDPQAGASLNLSFLNLGVSFRKSSRGKMNTVPAMSTSSMTIGTKLGVLAAEYSIFYMKTSDPNLAKLALYSRPTQILTGTLALLQLRISAAYRKAYNVDANPLTLVLLGAQYHLFSRLSLAVQHNYLPGATSLSAQLLF